MKQLQQIAERCQQGDRKAFAELYAAMREPMCAACRQYVADDTIVEDLLHDAFLLIIPKIGELKDTACVKSWMTMVMRRVALQYLRRRHEHQLLRLNEHPDTTLPHVSNGAEAAIAVEEILAAVEALPNGYRRVFRMSVFDDMSHQEIAALLHIEPHSSSSQLFHAKQLLRRWLAPMLLLLMLIVAGPVAFFVLERQKAPQPAVGQASKIEQPSTDAAPHTKPSDQSEVASIPLPAQPTQPVRPARPVIPIRHHTPTVLSAIDSVPPAPSVANTSVAAVDTLQPQHADEGEKVVPYTPQDVHHHQTQIAANRPSGKDDRWTLSLAYSGLDKGRNLSLPYADSRTNDAVYDSVAHHHMPLTIGLTLNRRIGTRWQVGVGLRYERLSTDMRSGNTYVALSQHQLVQYIGLPVSASWHQPLWRGLSTYLAASLSLSIPLRATLESTWEVEGRTIDSTTERLHPGIQWSAGLGLGLQYQLTPGLGIFAEPTLQYHFNSGGTVRTWNTEHPWTFALPIGLRITF